MGLDERSKGEYQPWNHEEFMADRKVRRMKSCTRKTYAMLLHEAFFCSWRPYLPNDDDELWTLADCDSLEEWLEMKPEIVAMFEEMEIDGQQMLYHPRVAADWERLLEKREDLSERGRKGGLARQAKLRASRSLAQAESGKAEVSLSEQSSAQLSQVSKLSKKESEEKLSEEGEQDDMKSEKLIALHCQTILKTNADLSENNKFMLKTLDTVHKGSVVARAFEVWAREHQFDETRKPVSAFLKVADDLLSEESPSAQSVKDNVVVKRAGREIAYITDNQVALDNKHKAVLAAAVEEEDYTFEEVMLAFREFFQNLDTSRPNALTYAAKNFSEEAADRLYAVRRKAGEKQQETVAVAAQKEKLEREAEEERRARLAALELEKQAFDEELPE